MWSLNESRQRANGALCPTPSLYPYIFSFARISFFGMGEGARSGFFKEEAAKFKCKIQNCLVQIIPFLCVCGYATLVGVHPRHPPRAFPLGLRVPRCLC